MSVVLTVLGEIAWHTGGDPEPFIAQALEQADSSVCPEEVAAMTYYGMAELCIEQRDPERASEFLARGDSTPYAQTMSGGMAALTMLTRLELDLMIGRAVSAPAKLARAKGLIPPGHVLPQLHHDRVASLVKLHQGELDDARRCSAANIEDYRSSGRPATGAVAAYVFGRDLDDFGQASRAELAEAVDLARSFGHHRHVGDLTGRLNRLS